jgi:Fe-S-cluster containining protein
MAEANLLFSQEVKYGCTLCGECCRERGRVPLEEEVRRSLRDRDWSGTPLAGLAGEDPEFFYRSVPSLPMGGAFALSEGACVLLGKDGLCQAHRHFGAEAKGTICRLFPYLFVEAPEGVYTGYSFCCRPVRNPKELATASKIIEESPESAYREARSFFPGIHYRKAPERVPVTQDLEIAWEDYLSLESGLLELLSMETGKPGYALVCGSVYLALSGLFLKELGDPEPAALSEHVRHFVQRMREEKYERVRRIASRVRARQITRRYVIGVMLGLHKAGMQARAKRDERGGPGMISRMALLRAAGVCFLSRQPKADLPADLFWDLTGRYLRHVVWRKGLVLGRGLYRMGGLIREYAMVLVYYALIEFEARRRAEEMGAEAAILEAIRTVERDFVLHAGRDATGPREEERDTFELFLGLFDSLVSAKSFAPSMTQWQGKS